MAWRPTPVFLPGESPWTEEPGGLQSIVLQRLRYDWSDIGCIWLLQLIFFFFTSTDFYYYPVQFNCSVMSDSLWPHARLPCPSPAPGDCSNSCLLNQWCHPTISSSVVPFTCLQTFSASGSFSMSQFFTSGGQSIGASASASVLPMNIQDWFPLGGTGWISLQPKELSRVFSIITVQKDQFFSAQLSL